MHPAVLWNHRSIRPCPAWSEQPFRQPMPEHFCCLSMPSVIPPNISIHRSNRRREEKFSSPIAQGGTNVSGGQKQRLAIARAIAKNPEIYIFDDSFSALDFKTDAKLRKALREYTKDSTLLIVAQRISSIMNADKIIVLDQGKIVGIGKHKELIKNCKVYREIASSQLGEEEIING